MKLIQVVLENGLRIISYTLPHRYAISINARVCTGSVADPDHSSGAAHLLEHMLFQGTSKRPNNYALTAPLEAFGGSLTAATHAEYTSFWAGAPRDSCDLALDVLLDLVRNPTIEPEKLIKERQVVSDEIAECQEDGFSYAQLLLNQALWAEHPLGRPVLGNQKTVANLTTNDLQAFRAKYYVPNNIVITLIGDVDATLAIEMIKNHWQDWPRKSIPLRLPPPITSVKRYVRCERDGNLIHLMLGFKVVSLDHPDQAAYYVIRTLLGEGMSSRLHTALRGEDGLAYSVQCTYDEFRHACVLGIYLAVQPKRAIAALDRVMDILRDLHVGRITPDEAERVRNATAGQLLVQADHPFTHARHICLQAALTGGIQSLENFIEQVRQVNQADLCRCGAVIGAPDNWHLAAVGPVDDHLWQAIQDEINDTQKTQEGTK